MDGLRTFASYLAAHPHEVVILDIEDDVVGGERKQRDRLLPEHVRVVRPRILKAVALGELNQLEPALIRRIRQNGDPEAEH